MTEVRSDSLDGKAILTQDGREIGEVRGLYIDLDGWRVVGLRAKLRRSVLGALSLSRPLLGTRSCRISVSQISGISDTVVLRHELAELSSMDSELLEVEDEDPQQGDDKREKKREKNSSRQENSRKDERGAKE